MCLMGFVQAHGRGRGLCCGFTVAERGTRPEEDKGEATRPRSWGRPEGALGADGRGEGVVDLRESETQRNPITCVREGGCRTLPS